MSSFTDAMESCPTCRAYFSSIIEFYELCEIPDDRYFQERCPFDLQMKFKESKLQGCQLCLKIFEFLSEPCGVDYDEETAKSEFFEVHIHASYLQDDKIGRRNNRISLMEFYWSFEARRNRDLLPRYFAIWLNEETENRAALERRDKLYSYIVNWSPVLSNNSTEISGLVQRMLDNCKNNHTSCSLTKSVSEEIYPDVEEGTLAQQLSGEVFERPSRFLCIEDVAGVDYVKLVEPKHAINRYCALSHCWGPELKHPLKTKKKNLAQHLKKIPWSSLPKTFREAIELTRGLGINYMWVDSLCIVQDDEADWKHEAGTMASVYKGATLVIAAADASDSIEGLFLADRPNPQVFRLPITISDGHVIESLHIAEISRTSRWSGLEGPLMTRGWVLQELYLGRRIVFFTSKGIRWKCRCPSPPGLNERGSDIGLVLSEVYSWILCLRVYSGKLLTNMNDRITALLGIVAELKKKKVGTFNEAVGLWEDGLVEQLLWRQLEPPHSQLDLPSWCWAAAGGEKWWMFGFPTYDSNFNLDGHEQTIKLSHIVEPPQPQSLIASGLLSRVTIGPLRLGECCIEALRNVYGVSSFQMLLGPSSGRPQSDQMMIFRPLRELNNGSALGIGYLDFGVSFSECFCFILSSNTETTRLREEAACHEIVQSFRDSIKHPDWTKTLWALLLQPIDSTLQTFRRAGIAFLWQHSVKESGFTAKEFKII